MTFRSIVNRLLVPAALVLPACVFAGWLVRGAQPGEFLLALSATIAAAMMLAVLAMLIWARPDVRAEHEVQAFDALLLLVCWALWLAGAFAPPPVGPWLLAGAVLATIVAVLLETSRFRSIAREYFDEARDRLRRQGANPTAGQPYAKRRGEGEIIEATPAGPVSDAAAARSRSTFGQDGAPRDARPARKPRAGTRASAPGSDEDANLPDSSVEPPLEATGAPLAGDHADAVPGERGEIATDDANRFSGAGATAAPGADPDETGAAGQGTSDGAAPGAMPGSTRIGPGSLTPSESTRPGINFGVNRAPVSPDWDPTRPVGPRIVPDDEPEGLSADDAAADDAARDDAR